MRFGLVWSLRQHQGLSGAQSTLPAASAAHLQLFLGRYTAKFLVVHEYPFPFQHYLDASIAKTATLFGNYSDLFAQINVIGSARFVPHS